MLLHVCVQNSYFFWMEVCPSIFTGVLKEHTWKKQVMYCKNNCYIQILFENFYYIKIVKLCLFLFACVCVCRSENNFGELVIFFHLCIGSGNWSQAFAASALTPWTMSLAPQFENYPAFLLIFFLGIYHPDAGPLAVSHILGGSVYYLVTCVLPPFCIISMAPSGLPSFSLCLTWC